jgi:hypothetical protein
MVAIGCPWCSKLGTALAISGLAILITSSLFYQLWLLVVGILVIIAAYIVPSLVTPSSCPDSTCTTQTPDQKEE